MAIAINTAQSAQFANELYANCLASCAASVDFLYEDERYNQYDARVYAYGIITGSISTTLGIIQRLEVMHQQNPVMVDYLKSRRERLLSLEVALRNSVLGGDLSKAREAIDKANGQISR